MAFQFKIQIKNITKPPVWRKLLVPESISFDHFHLIIQAAFGWEDYHMYHFSRNGFGSEEVIGIVDEDDEMGLFDETKLDAQQVRLSEIFGFVGQKYMYIYDFGDGWVHQITLEDIREESILNAQLLAGKGACPPEDCGGVWGYAELKDILSDKKHPEHKEMKKWLGLKPKEEWNPDYFDLDMHKMMVQQSLSPQ